MIAALEPLSRGGRGGTTTRGARGSRRMSAEVRHRISEAQEKALDRSRKCEEEVAAMLFPFDSHNARPALRNFG